MLVTGHDDGDQREIYSRTKYGDITFALAMLKQATIRTRPFGQSQ